MSDAPVASRPQPDTLAFPAVLRACLAGGLAAGLVAALVSWLVVQRPIRAALGVERSRPHEPGAHVHQELVSRPVQVVGGMLAAVLAALAVAAVFAVVYARLRSRLPGRTDFARSVTLAVAGFLVVSLLPAIKYPANPPAVGAPETVDERTWYYLSFLAAAVLAAAALWTLRNRLPGGWPASWRASTLTVLAVGVFGLLVALWPVSPDPLPPDLPAGLIWQFRLSSLAELASLWGALGITAGLLMEHRAYARGGGSS